MTTLHRRNLFTTLLAFFGFLAIPKSSNAASDGSPTISETQVEALPGRSTLEQQADYMRKTGNELGAGSASILAESDLLRAMLWLTIQGGAYTYSREDDVVVSFSPGVGYITSHVECLYPIGCDIDIDNYLLKTHGDSIVGSRRTHEIRTIAHRVTNMLVNGWKGSFFEEQEPVKGLKDRATPDMTIRNSGPLRRKNLDEAISLTDNPTHILMGPGMHQLMLDAGLLHGEDKNLYTTADKKQSVGVLVSYERPGRAEIIGFNEFRKTTSIYVLNSSESGYLGLTHGLPDVISLGKIDEKPVHRTRFEWLVAHMVLSKRALARLHNIRNGPVRA